MATTTTRLGLVKPADNEQDWGGEYRSAMDALDVLAGTCFVGPTQPSVAAPYLWVQTGLGADGTDVTFWIEDGS